MKKTIAKIMAAAMVVSTITAPNVLAAEIGNGSAKTIAGYTTVTRGDATIYKDGVYVGDAFDFDLSDDEYSALTDYSTSTQYIEADDLNA